MPPTLVEPRSPKWAWLALLMAIAWVVLARVPLLLNSEAHLDSDLAVDGLTLIDALNGHWRWHYPGTPHMGAIPVLLSWPQAMIWGANPITLASGGLVAYGLVVVSTFLLASRTYGPRVACWALIPLAFASTGTTWLSGRITGGHLLTVAWHAAAFTWLHACLTRGGFARVFAFGIWCGLGIYLDRMFVLSVAAIVTVAIGAWIPWERTLRKVAIALVFFIGIAIGDLPHQIGVRSDPNDSYPEQFAVNLPKDALVPLLIGHSKILALDCIPRLIAGHRLPRFESEPSPESLARPIVARGPREPGLLGIFTTGLTIGLFLLSMVALSWDGLLGRDPSDGDDQILARRAVSKGILLASLLVMGGFVLNRNIFNSDNYRYLVFLLVPWAVGFGLLLDRLARWKHGWLASKVLACVFSGLMTTDLLSWYQRFGWVDDLGRPVRRSRPDPTLAWLDDHREIAEIFGGYWDVYRLSFLTGGRVRGVPYPIFPDRFPEWSNDLPGHRPRIVVVRPSWEGERYRAMAMAGRGKVLWSDGAAMIIDWP